MKHSAPHSSGCSDCAGAVQRLPRNAGRALIWIYRHTLSPLVGYNCRHLPTCSVYGDEAIERFGLWAGGWMTLARMLRCQPWGTSGIDNVPATAPPPFVSHCLASWPRLAVRRMPVQPSKNANCR